jgi:hypothetical protein
VTIIPGQPSRLMGTGPRSRRPVWVSKRSKTTGRSLLNRDAITSSVRPSPENLTPLTTRSRGGRMRSSTRPLRTSITAIMLP